MWYRWYAIITYSCLLPLLIIIIVIHTAEYNSYLKSRLVGVILTKQKDKKIKTKNVCCHFWVYSMTTLYPKINFTRKSGFLYTLCLSCILSRQSMVIRKVTLCLHLLSTIIALHVVLSLLTTFCRFFKLISYMMIEVLRKHWLVLLSFLIFYLLNFFR